MSTPFTFTLNCFFLDDDDSNRIFQLVIAPTATVYDLKKAIKAEKSHALKDVSVVALHLWRTSFLVDSNFNENIAKINFLDEEKLLPWVHLSEILSAPVEDHLHVVIKCPSVDIQPPSKRRRLFSEPQGADPLDEENPAGVHDTVQQIIERYRPTIEKLVANAGQMPLIPSWMPNPGSSSPAKITFEEHIKTLAIPTVKDLPSLLLHDLYMKPGVEQAKHIADIFSLYEPTVLINTSDSGKTRLGLHGLCQNWGFYAVVKKVSDSIGSDDFRSLMDDLDDSRFYNGAKSSGIHNSGADHMEQKARHRILQFLSARFCLLNLLIDEATKCKGGLHPVNHRHLWVLLQAIPEEMLPGDAFKELAEAFRWTPIEDLQQRIKDGYSKLQPILEFVEDSATRTYQPKRRPLYCFLDEIQMTTRLRMGESRSDDKMMAARPLLRTIWSSITRVLNSDKMILIVSGTSIDWKSLQGLSGASCLFLPLPYNVHRDIGAFDDPDAQKQYIERYLPGEQSAARDAFLERAWGWCRGRYGSTAALIQHILLNSSRSPHRVLDLFVETCTNFRPTDGQKWCVDEPELDKSKLVFQGWPFERLDPQQITTLCDVLYQQIVYGRYSLKSFVREEDINAFIEYGIARTKSEAHVIDEPLAIMAVWNWLGKESHFAPFTSLQRDIDKHAWKNVFEAYLAFYMRQVFEKTPRLDEISTFRSDFAFRKGTDLSWQNEDFELVVVSMQGNERKISVVTPSCGPSPNVSFLARTDEEVLSWISENKEHYAFCFPTESAGPDIFFYIRSKITQRLLLVAIQAKQYQEVDKSSLVQGVRAVTPSWFWKSKDVRYQSPDEIRPQASSSSDIASRFFDALDDIGPSLTATNARYPVLRVFAPWPADAMLERTLDCKEEQKDMKTKNRTQAKVDEGIHDPDLHPLATLHLENFTNTSKTLSKSWYRGVEQMEVVFAKRQCHQLQRSKIISSLSAV